MQTGTVLTLHVCADPIVTACVCVCVCACACACLCACVCVCVCVCLSVCVCMWVRMHVIIIPVQTHTHPLPCASVQYVFHTCCSLTHVQDVIELLEKRVKSRFSHRQVNLFCDYSFEDYVGLFKSLLTLPAEFEDGQYREEWNRNLEVFIATYHFINAISVYTYTRVALYIVRTCVCAMYACVCACHQYLINVLKHLTVTQ